VEGEPKISEESMMSERISSKIEETIHRVFGGHSPKREEILHLLRIDPHSLDGGFIMASANTLSRRVCLGRAEVHAQIGLNLSPCPNNCSFCSFAASNGIFGQRSELEFDEVVRLALQAEAEGANALFLMSTADYALEKYLKISQEVRAKLQPETVMIANIGDFGYEEGRALKAAGYAGIYHAVRMGEGRDTRIAPETRLKTIRAAQDAGLLVGTCVEPIGPEHTPEELAEKILIGREIQPCYSGAARRIAIPGSPLEKFGMISEYRMAFLVAVVRLAMGRKLVGNCTHEPNLLGAAAGANLFWAEAGANPRDTEVETSEGRGLGVKACIRLFQEADFDVLQGSSVIYSQNNKRKW
jgi:biotin synthase